MSRKTNWIKFYDKTAYQRDKSKEYKPSKKVGKGGSEALLKEVVKSVKNGMKIIDIGCGTGRLLLDVYKIADKKVEMIGIDNSPGMIEVCKKNSKGMRNISFVLMDAFEMKFEDNSFDIAVNRLGVGPKSYKEIFRILKDGGFFILYIAGDEDWKEARKVFGFKKYYSLKEQKRAIKDAGFKVVKIKKFKSIYYFDNLESFVKMLKIVPFKPPFDRKKHANKLEQYLKKYRTKWGIKATQNKIIIKSKK